MDAADAPLTFCQAVVWGPPHPNSSTTATFAEDVGSPWQLESQGRGARSLSFPHSASQYTRFQMYQCVALSGVPVGGAEEPLLGYKCPTSYRWKGIYKRVVSLCHDSNFTPTTQIYDLTVL